MVEFYMKKDWQWESNKFVETDCYPGATDAKKIAYRAPRREGRDSALHVNQSSTHRKTINKNNTILNNNDNELLSCTSRGALPLLWGKMYDCLLGIATFVLEKNENAGPN